MSIAFSEASPHGGKFSSEWVVGHPSPTLTDTCQIPLMGKKRGRVQLAGDTTGSFLHFVYHPIFSIHRTYSSCRKRPHTG